MAQVETKYLELHNANLCFEVSGSGTHVIFVPGASGDATVFRLIRNILANSFTVVLYDRRGFSRSELTGEQDYTNRIATDVDDIYQIMRSLTNEKFIILESSSGAVVTLKYFETHPDTLLKAFAHEPPVLSALTKKEEHYQFQYDMVKLYREGSRAAAMVKFIEKFCGESDKQFMMNNPASQGEQRIKTSEYWFEHEVSIYPTIEVSEQTIDAHKNKLVLICGEENRDGFITQPAHTLAEKTGVEFVWFAGCHLSYLTTAKTFADAFVAKLKSENIVKKKENTFYFYVYSSYYFSLH
jgi:hypothetical protein